MVEETKTEIESKITFHLVGENYWDGQDYQEACRRYRLGVDQKEKHSQYALGCAYANGKGVEKNQQEALRLYDLSADQSYCCAQCALGICYYSGNGVVQDLKKAVELFKLSAAQSNPVAQQCM